MPRPWDWTTSPVIRFSRAPGLGINSSVAFDLHIDLLTKKMLMVLDGVPLDGERTRSTNRAELDRKTRVADFNGKQEDYGMNSNGKQY